MIFAWIAHDGQQAGLHGLVGRSELRYFLVTVGNLVATRSGRNSTRKPSSPAATAAWIT
jgi:hypothetical protein